MRIDTKHITSINATLPSGLNFATYSNMFLTGHLDAIFNFMLSSPPYNVPQPTATDVAPLFRNALMAYYAGDENISPEEQAKVQYVGQIAPQLGMVLQSLWTDLPPSDNQEIIDLRINLK